MAFQQQTPSKLSPDLAPFTVNTLNPTFLRTDGRRYEYDRRLPHSQKEKVSMLTLAYMGSIVIMMLCAMSCVLALYRNTKLMERNLELIEHQVKLIMKSYNRNDVEYISDAHKFGRMISLKDACPPCPTEPPTPIEPYRNPVTVLNNEVGKKAQYQVIHVCVDPPIHAATLKIVDDPAFTGKSWSGRASSKQGAKQLAAWNAIKNDLPHLIELVSEEYIPSEPTNPMCNKPPPPS